MGKPPKKKNGQGTGARRIGGKTMGVTETAVFMGTTEKTIRSRIDRGLLPHRRWGGRVIVLQDELLRFLDELPGTSALTAVANVEARLGTHNG